MPILCKQCGFTNPDHAEICEICAEPLNPVGTTLLTAQPALSEAESEYYIFCPESQTRTMIYDPHAESFFCEGCKINHPVDGFIWNIEQKQKNKKKPVLSLYHEKKLILQELETGFRIELDKSGTLGRYGTYGAEFFREHNMLTVSGEHCLFLYKNCDWTVWHISRTNPTSYDGKLLPRNIACPVQNNKILNLAGTVSFLTILESCT